MGELKDSAASRSGNPQPTAAASAENKDTSDTSAPLRSVHTTSVPEILRQLASSILVTTYQAGKLVVLRNDDGVLNTHFRVFRKPMGLAVRGGRLAIGTEFEIAEYHNMPAVAAKLQPEGKYDACFLPRVVHSTGDVQIHEMAYVDNELWFANTQFSCLATRSSEYSFIPRWRPDFITALAPGDRCHLNGLCVVDDRVKYITALGVTDEPGGWRGNKRDGGILIDVESSEIIARGLSMPHSPRWHDGRLWLLESGTGTIGTIDLDTGRYDPIAEMPGFTRGLSFQGPLAFVGLSQVRESATFSGIPLVERLDERTCGVWVIDIRNGQTVGFVKFEDQVQEIFAVEVLPGMRFAELINEQHDEHERLASSYVLPDEFLSEVPDDLQAEPPSGQS